MRIWFERWWPLLALLALWQAWSWSINKALLVPSPWAVLQTLVDLFSGQQYPIAIAISVWTLIKSWTVVLILLAITVSLSVKFRVLRRFISFCAAAFMPLPTMTLLPIMMLFFGISDSTTIAMLVFGSLWITYMQIMTAVDVSRAKWDPHVRQLGWTSWHTLWRVYLPSMAPTVLATMQMAWNLSWRALMALEIVFGAISAHESLGSLMMQERASLNVNTVWACLITIIAIGLAVDWCFNRAKTRLAWQ